MPQSHRPNLSLLEYHVLVALGSEPQYGYAIRQSVEVESNGALTPRAGSLYRVLARLMTWGYVTEAAHHPEANEPHPGLERRYYTLTTTGRKVVIQKARRLREAAELAEQRLGLADGTD